MTLDVDFEITNNCPLDCIHCSTVCNQGNSQVSGAMFNQVYDLADANYKSLYDIFNKSKDKKAIITFTGGEPLIDMYNIPVIKAAIKSNYSGNSLKFNMFTSGIKPDLKSVSVNEWRYMDLDHVTFSLYSDNLDDHNNITQLDRSWSTTVRSIFSCKDAGYKFSISCVPINLINPNNFATLCLDTLGAESIKFKKIQLQGRAKNLDIRKIKKYELLLKNAYMYCPNGFLIDDKRIKLSGWPCTKCKTESSKQFYVQLDGKVLKCGALKEGKCNGRTRVS